MPGNKLKVQNSKLKTTTQNLKVLRLLVLILTFDICVLSLPNTVYAADFGLFGAPVPITTPSGTSNSSGSSDGGGGSSSTSTSAPPGVPSPQSPNGLTATYFDNDNFMGNNIKVIDPFIDYNWGFGSPYPFINKDNFTVVWSGQIVPPKNGIYTFYARTDDGVRLWINDRLIINYWKHKWAWEVTGRIVLLGDKKYKIRMEYFEKFGWASASLKWSALTQTTRTFFSFAGRKFTKTVTLQVVPKQVILSKYLLPE